MPQPVLYMRGYPQPSIYMRGYPPGEDVQSQKEMVDDLVLIADLKPELLEEVSQRLSAIPGFLEPARLHEMLQELTKDSRVAEALVRALRSIEPDHREEFLASLEHLPREESGELDSQRLARLKDNLAKLVQPYAAMKRFEKAVRLAEATGNRFYSVELLCDLRPIFDDTRTKIEGMIPYTRLHLVAIGEDGLPLSFEVELSRQDVSDLSDKARKAEQKLAALMRFVADQVPNGCPSLPLNRAPIRDEDDA